MQVVFCTGLTVYAQMHKCIYTHKNKIVTNCNRLCQLVVQQKQLAKHYRNIYKISNSKDKFLLRYILYVRTHLMYIVKQHHMTKMITIETVQLYCTFHSKTPLFHHYNKNIL